MSLYLWLAFIRMTVSTVTSLALAHTFPWWPFTGWSILLIYLLQELFGRNPWMTPPR